MNINIIDKNLQEIFDKLAVKYGTTDKQKIIKKMDKAGLLCKINEYKVIVDKGFSPPREKVVRTLADFGLYVVQDAYIDQDRLNQHLGSQD